MNRSIIGFIGLCFITFSVGAQTLKKADVPAAARNALGGRYPAAAHVIWEKEKGNFEANWGGRSNEDSSATFTPAGQFTELVVAIPVSGLPSGVAVYVKKNYPGVKITEAGRVTDAAGKVSYEAEVRGKDLVFDEAGTFIKKD